MFVLILFSDFFTQGKTMLIRRLLLRTVFECALNSFWASIVKIFFYWSRKDYFYNKKWDSPIIPNYLASAYPTSSSSSVDASTTTLKRSTIQISAASSGASVGVPLLAAQDSRSVAIEVHVDSTPTSSLPQPQSFIQSDFSLQMKILL